jgi:glycosyltransferase involved in cell wall biosynthesis
MPEFDTPYFSIVIPSFNSRKFVAQSLDSILRQNFTKWEVLIIDNFSNDGTDEILDEFDDPRIRRFKLNNHGSISASRNLGIKEAKAEWIAFLDSDDWWAPDKLFECSTKINSEVDLIYHDLIVISDNKRDKHLKCRQLKSPVINDLLVNGNPIAASSVVVRKYILQKIGYMNERPDLIKTADYNTWLKIANTSDSFLHIPKKLGYYRIHNNNVSDDSILEPTLAAMEEFLYLLSNKKKTKIKLNLIYAQARVRFISKNYSQAWPDLVQVIKHGSILRRIKAFLMLLRISINI